VLDGVVDAAVVSFALWTLFYCVGLVTQWRLWAAGWLWLAATAGLVAWQVVAAVRTTSSAADAGGEDAAPEALGQAADASSTGRSRGLLVLGGTGAAASAVAVLAAVLGWPSSFRLDWLATVVAVVALGSWAWAAGRLAAGRRTAGVPGPDPGCGGGARTRLPGRWSGTRADLGVLLVLAACVVLSLFVHLADTDDPYYLNRSVWVAEHGNAALRDTMFSPEVFNTPYGGGVPIASLEALIGVLAHLTGLRAGTMTYLVATPVGTALAVWALWRLARRWAPARAFLVLVVAVGFLTLSGSSMLGNFWIPRIWQGKVIAVTVLMPLLWAWLTEAADRGRTPEQRRRALALLLAGGVAFFGLTPTAVVWAPVMCGAALLAAVLVRSRSLAVGGLLALVGPLLSGLAVVAFSSEVGGAQPVALPSKESFVRVLGLTDPMVALALLALCLAPVAARRGAPAALAGASALLAVLVFAPGVLPLLNAVTGSGPILWRMLYVAPVPILVGLLASYALAPLSVPGALRRLPAARAVPALAGSLAVALVLLAGLVVGGRPVWSSTGHGGPVTVTPRPTWKLDLPSLDDVHRLDERGLLHGVVLLPPTRMKVLTMYTTKAFPVVPRDWFVRNIHEPAAERRARRLLFNLAGARPPFPAPSEVRAALRRLDVTLACTGRSPYLTDVVRRLEAAGYGDRTTVGSLTCVTPPR
jgi:hypothetical protein